MIVPNATQTQEDVARHYDDLDAMYRQVWGEHLHHGLWRTGREDKDAAVRALIETVADLGAIGAGTRVCDIGCGYGGSARHLAQRRGAQVTGLTISPAQLAFATRTASAEGNPRLLLRDWMDSGLESGAFEAAYSIESSEHMPDKRRFFSEAYRVLAPGGRLVVCAWLARTGAKPFEVRHLLEPICREGRLPGMGTEEEYRALFAEAGFELTHFEDVSAQVRRTWSYCIGAGLAALARDARYREFVLDRGQPNRIFAVTLFRLWAAYRTGAMRYGIFAARRPRA